MTDDHDDLSGIFDSLSPADFVRESSARDVQVLAGRLNLHTFTDACLESARIAFHAADGTPNPVGVMVTPTGRRLFSPDDDETLEAYALRLTREAVQHKATAFFTAVLTEGGTYEDGDQAQVDSAEALSHVEAKPCLYWYSEVIGEGIRHGILTIAAGETGPVYEAPSEHASPFYMQVLAHAR